MIVPLAVILAVPTVHNRALMNGSTNRNQRNHDRECNRDDRCNLGYSLIKIHRTLTPNRRITLSVMRVKGCKRQELCLPQVRREGDCKNRISVLRWLHGWKFAPCCWSNDAIIGAMSAGGWNFDPRSSIAGVASSGSLKGTKNMRSTLLGAATAAVLALSPLATALAGDISISEPWARANPAPGGAGAAFMVINNGSDTADTLLSASSPAAKVTELHTHVMDGDVMRMTAVEEIEVPANGAATLEPGGFHVMLMQLVEPLKEGTTFPLTLSFANAGEMTVPVAVMAVTTKGPMQHGDMQHGDGTHGGHQAPADARRCTRASSGNVGTDRRECGGRCTRRAAVALLVR